MLRAVMCSAGPQQMLADASFAVAQEPPWSPWRDTALCLCGEAHLLIGDVDQAGALFAESSTLAAAMSNTDTFVDSESELALLAMDRGRWAEAAEHVERRARCHRGASDARLRRQRARLRRRGPARPAPRRLEGGGPPARAGDAGPSDMHVRAALLRRARYGCNLPRCTAPSATRPPPVTCCRRSTTSCHTAPHLGALVDEVDEFRQILTSSAPAGAAGGAPLTPAELRLLPYLQTHLTIREIGERLFVSRNTVNSEIRSIYRKLGVSSRSDAVRQAMAIGLLGG